MALTLPGIAKLRNAALVLRETTGFAYLPIIVPHEVAGRDALQELQRASAVADEEWHEVVWPEAATSALPSLPLTPEAISEQREALAGQRKALLQSFDSQLLQDAHAGHALVLDASASTRRALATEVVTYLNQRREPLRSHQRRLIVVWPAALSDILLGGAPDLWSQRALSVVLADEDATLTPSGDSLREVEPILPSRAISRRPNPVVEAQLAQWFATHDLRRANLSGADALTLAEVLYERQDFVETQLLAEAVERAFPDDDGLMAAGKVWRGLALHGQGDRTQALQTVVDAVAIYRRLVKINPATYEPVLAGNLSNLAKFQSETGDRAGALAAALKAVEIYRRLAEGDPAAYEPVLAAGLNNLAILQSTTGDRAASMAIALEVVEIRRRLAKANPAAYEPVLAGILNNLAILQSATGDRTGALTTGLEAVGIRRRLAKSGPAAYELDLAMSLNNLAGYQSATGDRVGALATALDAVEIYRRMARANPSAYEPDLARSLCMLALALEVGGEKLEAHLAAEEAVTLIAPWAQKMPDAFASLRDSAQDLMERLSVES